MRAVKGSLGHSFYRGMKNKKGLTRRPRSTTPHAFAWLGMEQKARTIGDAQWETSLISVSAQSGHESLSIHISVIRRCVSRTYVCLTRRTALKLLILRMPSDEFDVPVPCWHVAR